MISGSSIWPCLPLKTGQTTSYVDFDDGYYEKGVARAYSVLTTGQYSGTFNIDLAHYTSGAGAITCTAATQTIADTGVGLAIFKTGDVILLDDSSNPGPFTIATGNVAGAIVVASGLVDSTPAGAITIKKREAHSNNCVLDLKTGLMWSRYVSGNMGLASDGALPWTTVTGGYGIFPYRLAANAGSGMAGFTDWRIPNIMELGVMTVYGVNPANLDLTAFPAFPTSYIWTSTTDPSTTTWAMTIAGELREKRLKTSNYLIIMVRGGN